MRGKADVSCAIFEEASNAQRIEVCERDGASPTGLSDMGVVDGCVAWKRESDGRVFALRPFVELGDVALKVGDRVGVLARELVDVANRFDGLRLRFPALSVVLHNREVYALAALRFLQVHGTPPECKYSPASRSECPAYPRIMPMGKEKPFMQVDGAYNMRVIVCGACTSEGEELTVRPEKKQWTYREKMAQANREAKATVVALAIVVVVWIVAGFGLSAFDVEAFGTPFWVFGGTIGTWVAAIVAAVVLGRRVFADFDLDEEERDANN